MKIAVLLIFIITLMSQAFGAEIDSVTPRKVKLENSLLLLNSIINQRLQEGVDKANEYREYIEDIDQYIETENYCDEEDLYTELRKAIYQSYTASWGLKGYDLDKQLRELLKKQSYSLSLNDSIYRDIDFLEGFSLNLKELSDIVNVNGYLIGLDKIGHFFSEGWQYFVLTNDEKQGIEEALAWGKRQESGKFGYSTTGIFSFADLTANFNGWRFWNKVLLKQDDPLKGAIANFFNRPYVSCRIQILDSIKNRKLVRAWEYDAAFDLSDYIDGAWDEGNNCNSYETPLIEQKVMARIKNVEPDFQCPFIPGSCVQAREKYGYFAKYLLHPSCLFADE